MSRFDAGVVARATAFLAGRRTPDYPATELMPDGPQGAEAIALALIRRFEGFRARPYLCPAGVPTIGVGATHYLDGRAVQLTDPPLSEDAAERLLLLQVRRTYMPAVQRLCPGIDTPQRMGALIDFCFNLGPGHLASSTLRKRINAGRWDDVPTELMKWVRGGGRVLPGLVARRRAEADLVLKESQ